MVPFPVIADHHRCRARVANARPSRTHAGRDRGQGDSPRAEDRPVRPGHVPVRGRTVLELGLGPDRDRPGTTAAVRPRVRRLRQRLRSRRRAGGSPGSSTTCSSPVADPNRCSGADQEGLEAARRSDPFSIAIRYSSPMTSNVPTVQVPRSSGRASRAEGRVPWLAAVVWFSASPVPNADEFLRLAQARPERLRYPVGEALENAEGRPLRSPEAYPNRPIGRPRPTTRGPRRRNRRSRPAAPVEAGHRTTSPARPDQAAGHPGQVPVPRRRLPGLDAERQPAINQCVPAAHANALAWLEQRYNFNPNIWNLPHHHVRGIGKFTLIGDIPFWEPVPDLEPRRQHRYVHDAGQRLRPRHRQRHRRLCELPRAAEIPPRLRPEREGHEGPSPGMEPGDRRERGL